MQWHNPPEKARPAHGGEDFSEHILKGGLAQEEFLCRRIFFEFGFSYNVPVCDCLKNTDRPGFFPLASRCLPEDERKAALSGHDLRCNNATDLWNWKWLSPSW